MEIDRCLDKEDGSVTNLRNRLESFCIELGYSYEDLAEELDVSRATIFNWKKDGRSLPRIVSLALFALESEPKLRRYEGRGQQLPKQYRRGAATKADVREKGNG